MISLRPSDPTKLDIFDAMDRQVGTTCDRVACAAGLWGFTRAVLLNCVLIGYLLPHAADAGQAKLDHVVVVVRDLQGATQHFRHRGFTLKQGRVHKNGLHNAFVEFSDGSELELMSVVGNPTDPLARAYSEFLSSGDGGVYIALSGFDIQDASNRLTADGIMHQVQPGALWDYLSFPVGSGRDHVFLIDTHDKNANTQTRTNHENGVSGVYEVWLESNGTVEEVLQSLQVTFHASEQRFALSNAWLKLEKQANSEHRPRILGVVFTSDDKCDNDKTVAYGLWMTSSDCQTR
ncbi:MAG: VOC family protein [Pseudomonadota bacterium]